MNFADLGLSPKTIQAIDEFGIKKPTTVQQDVIPSVLQGKDVFTIAPGGCGKTMSYIFPLIDIISNKDGKNILIITPDSEQSVLVSDRLSIFNKYHEINEATIKDAEENIDTEANVVIGSPDLLIDLVENSKFDFSKTNILIVDDINLIKKNKQLQNLEKILEILPSEKQNIVYTNRRSKETQSILEKILKTPQEIKVDKTKEQEANLSETSCPNDTADKNEASLQPANDFSHKKEKNKRRERDNKNSNKPATFAGAPLLDREAVEISRKYKSFNGKTPDFILNKGVLADDTECNSCNFAYDKVSVPY